MTKAQGALISSVLTMAHYWEDDDDSRDALETVFDAINVYLEAITPKQYELPLYVLTDIEADLIKRHKELEQ